MKKGIALLGIITLFICGPAIAADGTDSHPVTEYGAFVAGKNDPETVARNTETLNRALDKVGGRQTGEVVLPAGVFYIAPTEREIKGGGGAAVHIRRDNVTLRGAGVGKTTLRTRSEWTVVNGQTVRGVGIRIHGTGRPGSPRHGIVLTGFELDGGAGFTGNFSWPASTKDGDGWDITHKGIILAADDCVDDVTLDSLWIHGYRGEVIYAGGLSLGNVTLHHVKSEDTNASTFNITANFTAEDCEFGKSRFWVEIATRAQGKSGTFRRCKFHDASVTGIALCQGDGGLQPYLFENCQFTNAPAGVFALLGGVGGPVVIRNNTFTNAGSILNGGNSPGGTTNINKGVLMESNQAVRCGMLVNFIGNATNWTIRKNTFSGRNPATPGEATCVVYGATAIYHCAVTDNQFTDCRTPEQSAWITNDRPLFARNSYKNVERRDAQGVFSVTKAEPLVIPHFEQVTVYAGEPGAVPQFETKGYPDGQVVTITGGTPQAPVKFDAKGAGYTLKSQRVLNGTTLKLKFNKQTGKWLEVTQ